MSNSALYDWTTRLDLQCSFLAEQRTILGNFVPITDDDMKLRMKHQWSPTPPLWDRMFALTHSIPAVAKIASIETVPSLKVGGTYIPVHCRHCLLGKRVPVHHLLSQWSNVSVVKTGASEGSSGNLKVFGLHKICFLLYLYIELQKLWGVDSRENHSQTGSKLLQLASRYKFLQLGSRSKLL